MRENVRTGTMLHPGLVSTLGYRLAAEDGNIGRVIDWYFDDSSWTIRYVVADTGTWLSGRRVLVSPAVVGLPDARANLLPVRLTRRQVKTSPPWNGALPVSRQHEIDLQQHFGWPAYWPGPTVAGAAGMPPVPPQPSPEPDEVAREMEPPAEPGDPHLRGVREVTTYRIHARDGEIGHARDLLVEPGTWIVRYLVVDTGHFLPGRKVLISPPWIERIDWAKSEVHVGLDRDAVRKSPPYDPDTMLERAYEHRLHEHYDLPKYWM